MSADETQEAVDPRCGTTLSDRYRVVRRIGVGGMGVVYEGLHLLIQRRVAIKMLHPEYTRNREIVARFRREAIAATTIRHPHIVEVLDMGETPDRAAYMVLEFLDGRDWADDIATGGAQPLGKTVRILRQVCEGLQAAHDKNIVHRDLKPENIYLARHGSNADFVKIVDFGISKMLEDPDAAPGDKQHNLTKTGAAMGTPYAMAPEQMMGEKTVDHRADLWAIGVMLFRALTASYPFDADTFPMLAVSVLTGEPQPLSRFRGDLPPEIQSIVTRLLEKDRDARFQSAREIRDALASFESFDDAPKPTTPAFAMAATITPATPMSASGPVALPKNATAVSSPASTPEPSVPDAKPKPATAIGHRITPAEPPPTAPATGGSSSTQTPTGSMAAMPPAPPSVWTGAALAVVLITLGGGGTIFALRMLGDHADTAPPPATSDVPPPPTVEAAPPSTTPVPTVRLQITTTPDDAVLLFDGEPIPNPFDADVPSGAEHHTILARADGYDDGTRAVSTTFPMRVHIDLSRTAAGSGATRPRATTVRGTHVDPPPTTTTHADPPPSATAHVEAPPPTTTAPPPTTRGLANPFAP